MRSAELSINANEQPAAIESGRKAGIAKAAEKLFACRGYDATSIRDIAAAAGVNSALVRYHFGTKQDLYRALFERRYHKITEHRLAALEAMQSRPNSIQSLGEIVRIWTAPLFAMVGDPKSKDFVLLLLRESLDSTQDARGIFGTYLDPSARICIAAMRRAVPHAPEPDVVLSYLWLVTCVTCSLGTGVRMTRLLGSKARKAPPDAMASKLATFLTKGIWAMLHDPSSGPPA